MRPNLTPPRVAHTLTLAGIIGAAWFYLVQHNEFGIALAVTTLVGSGVVQYGSGKPFVVPLLLILLILLVGVQLVDGKLAAALIGAGLGTGLPYLAYRRSKHESSASPPGNP